MDTPNTNVLLLRTAELERELAAKNRQLEIEAALDRVRVKALAMQNSDELPEAAKLLFQQVQALGLPVLSCGYNIWEKGDKFCSAWMSDSSGSILPSFKIPLTESPTFIRFFESKQKGEHFYTEEVSGDALAAHYRYMLTLPHFSEIVEDFSKAGFALPTFQINHVVNFSHGNVVFITDKPVPEAWDIFQRFGKVFEQTYTRFLDLKKAEAQAREAKIEAALENVRASSLAMHHSDELDNVVKTLAEKLVALGISLDGALIFFFDKEKRSFNHWIATNHLPTPLKVMMSYEEDIQSNEIIKDLWEAIETGSDFMNKSYSGKVKNDYFQFIGKHNASTIPEEVRKLELEAESWTFSFTGGKNSVGIDSWSGKLTTPDEFEVLKRFAKVFEQAYTRFLDLQKAEAQAREAQIEAALEKVRSRSLAMHKSEELRDVVAVVFEKLQELNFAMNDGAAIIITFIKDSKDHIQWIADTNRVFAAPFKVPYSEHSISADIFNAKESGIDFFSKLYPFEEKNIYFKYLFENAADYKVLPDEVKKLLLQNKDYGMSIAFEKNSAIFIPTNTGKLVSENEKSILKRFAKVFEQSYIRFLDLQKAEAQAREAQIQLALERVRARTMAMQKSEELTEVATLLFKQVSELGIKAWTTGFNVWSGDNNYWTDYVTNPQGGFIEPYTIDTTKHSAFANVSEAKKKGEEFYVQCQEGEMLKAAYRHLSTFADKNQFQKLLASGFQFPGQQFDHFVFGSNASLMFITYEPVPEAHNIFKRFGKVFEQTYTRFLDLQKVETQAREAQIQLALERIRSRSLAMHHSNELKDVVAIVFQQLKTLGLAFDGGAAIHLFSENLEDAVIIVATADLAVPIQCMLPYDEEAFENNPIIQDVWHAKETGEHILNRFYSFEEKNKYFQTIVFKYNGLEILPQSIRDFILQADSYTASFIAEKNSLLGANSWTRQQFSENDFDILKRIGKVFEQAYIRFLDLKKAEALAVRAEQDLIEIKAARKKAEDTLTELKATQQQLIQSEKMASLGELTAGIAHEIQNPLNFVNNFSETNTELLEEAKTEFEAGNTEEGFSLLNDIQENEKKINHHGKRADSIVKGMLEHSRTSKGEKQPTNLNALVDEYLRLAYHGVRAKDKAFDADIQTHFDASLGKVNIVPQDIGRVLLNLFNNAFYAVNEKKKFLDEAYEPLVSVHTHKLNDIIQITVQDNGMGISKSIVDKIFQPFFTTKPTGQGTGLGLSLSYDIIKAHGGELKVVSKEGEGATFILTLPIEI